MCTNTSEISFSVIIPLYNKEREICRALNSALEQTFPAKEIIVIDDGSNDCSADLVMQYTAQNQNIKIIRQHNAGVSAARNKGISLATGSHIALLDADDWWHKQYLKKMSELIEEYPDCGAYSSAFYIVTKKKTVRSTSPRTRGIVENFFRQAMCNYICQPSSTIIPKHVFEKVGGFPEGMQLGEDLYMWIKIARQMPICFTPETLVFYCRSASNRSSDIYQSEQTEFSFEDFYDESGDKWLNEFIARCAIGKALTLSAKGNTKFGLRTERFFSYTEHYRFGWNKLRIMNRLPRKIKGFILKYYNRLAWFLAHKGL